jgi:phage FluMu protein Com
MTFNLTCQSCKTSLKVPEKFASKKIKCPKCAQVVVVPAVEEEEEAPVEVMPDVRVTTAPVKKGKAKSREEEDDEDDRRSRVRGERDDDRRSRVRQEEDDDRTRKRKRRRDEDEEDEGSSPYKRCPKCRARGAERVKWTAWGSFYGPAMFSHVRCPECGYCYNGKTGRSNMLPAIIFVSVPLLGILAILGAIFYILRVRGHI